MPRLLAACELAASGGAIVVSKFVVDFLCALKYKNLGKILVALTKIWKLSATQTNFLT